MNNQIIKKSIHYFSRYAITVFSCVLIIVLGIIFLTQANPGTTTIGENISTTNLTATGDLIVDTDTFYVDASGDKVGIGTATPQAGLHVSGADIMLDENQTMFFGSLSKSPGISGDSYGNLELSYYDRIKFIDKNRVSPVLKSEIVDEAGGFTKLDYSYSVYISGNYAYVTATNDDALTIIDISDPTSPVLKAEIVDQVGGFTKLNGAKDVYVSGNYAYVTANYDDALTIIDISDPTSPVLKAEIVDGVGGFTKLDGAESVYVSGNYAYVTASTDNALTIIDISDPTSPVLKAEIVDEVGGFTKLDRAKGVYVSGNYAYVVGYYDHALTIIDISDPTSPVLKAEIVDGVGGFTKLSYPAYVYVSGNYAYVTAGDDDALTIIDISDPTNPVLKAEIVDQVGGFTKLNGAKDVYVSGNYAYVTANYDDALTIIDISDPTSPVLKAEIVDEVGGFTKLDGANSVHVSGNYAYVVGYYDHALTIIDISNTQDTETSLTIDNLGHIGIGTDSPSYKLDISEDESSEWGARIRSSANTAYGLKIQAGNNVDDVPFQVSSYDGTSNYLTVSSAGLFADRIIFDDMTKSISYNSTDDMLEMESLNTNGIALKTASYSPASEIVDGVGGFNRLNNISAVHVSGNYAYVTAATDDALTIIDISDPTSPVLKSETRDEVGGFTKLNGATDVCVLGNYAYVTAYTDDALTIIDISDPTSPVLKAEIVDGVGGFTKLNGAEGVHVSGNYAYVVGVEDNALTIIDISDPVNPVFKAEIVDGVGGFTKLDAPHAVYVSGNYAYVTSSTEDALTIIDISDPVNPVLKSEIVDEIGGFTKLERPWGPNTVYVSGNYAYITAMSDKALTIIDISDPTSPVLKAEIVDGIGGFTQLYYASSVYVSGNYAYVTAADDDALTIIDISDVSSPNQFVLDSNGNVGIGTITPSNKLSVTPAQYSVGTASQSLTTVTGIGTTFTSAMVGSQLVYADGTDGGAITAFGSATSLTVSSSQTVTAQVYNIVYTGLQVNSTGNVGIGTATPNAKLDIVASESNLLSLGSANTATWSKIGGDGANSSWNTNYEYVFSQATFNGKLYAGLGSGSGDAEVWEYDGSSWTQIGGDGTGWGSTYERLYSLTTFNGKLYAGVSGHSAGEAEVWEYDGSSWTQIGGDGISSSWNTDYELVYSLTTFNGKLYAGLGFTAGDAEVWEYNGSSWTKIGGDGMSSGWNTGYEHLMSLTTFNGKLYAGVSGETAGEAELWEYDNSSWTKIGGDGVNSSWNTDYEFVYSLTTFNGKLYAGVSGYSDGEAELWEYDGSTWTKIGGDGTGWADSTYQYVQSLTTFNGKLYAGVGGNIDGEAELWEYDGSSWTQIGGDGISSSWDTDYERVSSLTTFNGKLYAGLGDDITEAEVWEYDGSSWTTFARNGVGLSIGDYMYMGRNGYVGINNPEPESALDITGDLTVSDSLLVTYHGNVGIGTATPSSLLEVKQGGTGNIADFKSGASSILTVQDADRLKMRDNTLLAIGDINEAIIDDMESAEVAEWVESDGGNTDVITETSVVRVNDGAMKITTDQGSITAATIAFVDGGAGADTITDSGSGFVTGGFHDGDVIDVTGSTSNDGSQTIVSVVAGTITLATGVLTAEGASATVTIKGHASNTDTLTKTISSTDYSANDRIGFWIRATETGQIISLEFNDDGGSDPHHDITIDAQNQWQYEEWDISSYDTAIDAVTEIIFIIDDDTNEPTIYIDQLRYYDKDNRSGEMFVDGDGHLVLAGEQGIELQANITSSLPGMKIGAAIVEINQPFAVNVAGDTGINYDLTFLNTGTTFVTSAGPLVIAAGDPNHSENLTITTGGSGDVIVDIADSRFGFKVLGVQGGYVFRILPSGDLDINSIASNLNTPFGGFGQYQNLLTYSEELENAIWVAANLAGTPVVLNEIASPDGADTADEIVDDGTGGGTLTQTEATAIATETWTFSIWIKDNDTTGNISIEILDNGTTPASTSLDIDPYPEWQRYSVTHTGAAGATSMNVIINHDSTANNSFYAWGAQFEETSDAGVYAYTTSSEVATGTGLLAKNLKLSSGVITLGDYTRTIKIPATTVRVGSTAPTETTIENTRGLGFDADGELAFIAVPIPSDWNGTSDLTLITSFCGTSGDAIADTETVKFDISYNSVAANEAIDNGTEKTATATYTQSGAGTDKEMKLLQIIIDYDNADQPLTAGDALFIKFNRDVSTDTYSGAAIVQAWALQYTSNTIPK